MSIAVVTLTVPVSGDGPASDISSLVGPKTVTLTGLFSGSYVLLVSDTGAPGSFVPALEFDAGGVEGIEQTISGAFRYAAVRCLAQPQGVVGMKIAAIVAPGENRFGALATIPPGSGGTQPAIDTYAVFPPTGLEGEIAIICRGIFVGDIVIEGSEDGVKWNPVGEFSAGPGRPSLLGNPQVLEFSPLPTDDLVRYLRVNANADVLGTTIVTIGGRIFVGGAGGDVLEIMHEDRGKATTIGATDPEILYEETADLSSLPAGTPISAHFSGIALASGTSVGTFEVWIGATNPGDNTGAVLAASLTVNSSSEVVVSAVGAAIPSPGGDKVLVQLVGSNDTPGAEHSDIRGLAIRIFS